MSAWTEMQEECDRLEAENEQLRAALKQAVERSDEDVKMLLAAREALAENERLRADVIRNGNTAHRLMTELATANALLERAKAKLGARHYLHREIQAHLAGQTAAPAARTAAEQRVLDAWGATPIDTLYMWAAHPSEHVRNASRAELARREAANG